MSLKEHEINQSNNFICGWYIDEQICDRLVEYHKQSTNKWVGTNNYNMVNLSAKNSIDCRVDDIMLGQIYSQELQKCIDAYCKKYEFVHRLSHWNCVEFANLQHYTPPDGGYHIWHCERDSGVGATGKRLLVFMTYLNDVTDKGETEFYYQKLKIKPEKGLTIIWPADWMFTHRGIASPTQEKYIYTGWLSFVE